MLFPASSLDAIEQAIKLAEATHAGEIRFAIEAALPPLHILNDHSSRVRALEVFSYLRVWDTAANNGVLIYVQLADRKVEIVADRGINGRVGQMQWETVCRLMESHYREGRFEAGSVAGVEAVGSLLASQFPDTTAKLFPRHNQLPDRPTLL